MSGMGGLRRSLKTAEHIAIALVSLLLAVALIIGVLWSSPSHAQWRDPVGKAIVYAPSAGSAFTVDLANGNIQKFTTNNNITVTLPASVVGKVYRIVIAYGGSHTLTFAGGSTIKWAGGATPVGTATNAKFDIFDFWCDGTNTYGTIYGQNF